MPDDKNIESFALGAVLVILAYWLFDKKLSRRGGAAFAGGGGASGGNGGGGGCGCGGASKGGTAPGLTANENPIPLGGQPLTPSTGYQTSQATGYKYASPGSPNPLPTGKG